MENQEIELVEDKQSFGEKVEEFCDKHYTTILTAILASFAGAGYVIVKRSCDRTDTMINVLALMSAYQMGSSTKESK